MPNTPARRPDPPPKSPALDEYFRLPQVILDRSNPRHMELLEAMRQRGFYRPDSSKRMTGYAELVRSFLFWYFGLSPWEMPVGAPLHLPGAADEKPTAAPGPAALPIDGEQAADVAESDDLVASYVFGWGTR